MRIAGLRVIESSHMVDGPFEDWSRVRSPGRARRRRGKHRQNIRIFYTPKPEFLKTADAIIGHPAMCAKLKAAILERQPRNDLADAVAYGLSGLWPL